MWVEQIRLLLLDAPFIGDFTQAPFLFRPFLMLVTLGVVSGVVGVVVNLRRLEFNAEAMVHSVFPGVVAGAVFGGLDMIIPGAGLVGIVVAVVLTVVGKRGVHTSEAGTAVVLTSFFSLGIVLSLRLGDKSGQLEALMFGRLLEVTNQRLEQSLIVCAVALLMVAVTWKRQIFVAFDRAQAQAQGVNVLAIDLIINVAIAAVVIAAASAVGVLLVVGYLVVPGATARLLARTVRTMVIIAIVVGVAGGLIGMKIMLADTPHPVSPQAAVALSVIGAYFAALPVAYVRSRIGAR
jgi:ABC transport system, permease component